MKILIVHDWAIVRSGIKQVQADEFGPQELRKGRACRPGLRWLQGHGIFSPPKKSSWSCSAC